MAGTAGGIRHAALWTAAGTVIDLDVCRPSMRSVATVISDSGLVVGNAATGDGWRATLWTGDRGVHLGVLPGAETSHASAVNAGGVVVGQSGSDKTPGPPFVWRDGELLALPALAAGTGNANSINAAGQIVGTCARVTRSGPPRIPTGDHAVRWEDGKLVDLNDVLPRSSGWLLEEAVAINDQGWIAGNGWAPGERYPGMDRGLGRSSGFLLVPE